MRLPGRKTREIDRSSMGQETREAHQLNVSEGVAAPSTKKDAASEIVILRRKGFPGRSTRSGREEQTEDDPRNRDAERDLERDDSMKWRTRGEENEIEDQYSRCSSPMERTRRRRGKIRTKGGPRIVRGQIPLPSGCLNPTGRNEAANRPPGDRRDSRHRSHSTRPRK